MTTHAFNQLLQNNSKWRWSKTYETAFQTLKQQLSSKPVLAHYSYNQKFLLVTDHKPLMAIFSPKASLPALAAVRLQRWAITLSAYNYDIEFRQQ